MPVRVLLLILCLAISVSAQSSSIARPTFDRSDWVRPTPPLRIAGTIHYVGTHELGAYLIATSDGHILLDGTVREAAPAVVESIRTLGFDPKDIRVLLISQAHFDHVGSLAYFKRLTGARVEVMAGDDTIVESGGRTDYLFADDPALHFEPVKVDRVLHDGGVRGSCATLRIPESGTITGARFASSKRCSRTSFSRRTRASSIWRASGNGMASTRSSMPTATAG